MSDVDPFARPRRSGPSENARTEDGACRALLKVAGVPVHRLIEAAGLAPGASYITFDVMSTYADFPFVPAVTAEPLDDMLTLLTKFERSRLWRAWVKAWDTRPDVSPGNRLLMIHGSHSGYMVAHASPAPPDRPHVSVGHVTGTVIRLEPLSSWCRGIQWASPD